MPVPKTITWKRTDPEKPPGLQQRSPAEIALHAMVNQTIHAGTIAQMPINAQMQMPDGYWGELRTPEDLRRQDIAVDEFAILPGEPVVLTLRSLRKPVPGKQTHVFIQADDVVAHLVLHAIVMTQLKETE